MRRSIRSHDLNFRLCITVRCGFGAAYAVYTWNVHHSYMWTLWILYFLSRQNWATWALEGTLQILQRQLSHKLRHFALACTHTDTTQKTHTHTHTHRDTTITTTNSSLSNFLPILARKNVFWDLNGSKEYVCASQDTNFCDIASSSICCSTHDHFFRWLSYLGYLPSR